MGAKLNNPDLDMLKQAILDMHVYELGVLNGKSLGAPIAIRTGDGDIDTSMYLDAQLSKDGKSIKRILITPASFYARYRDDPARCGEDKSCERTVHTLLTQLIGIESDLQPPDTFRDEEDMLDHVRKEVSNLSDYYGCPLDKSRVDAIVEGLRTSGDIFVYLTNAVQLHYQAFTGVLKQKTERKKK